MKMMKRMRQSLSYLLCILLIVAMALLANGCGDNKDTQVENSAKKEATTDSNVLGEGNTVFEFTVVDLEGSSKTYEVHTEETTVGAALQEVGLIAGEEGEFGLYVKTVDGITLDYDADGAYWSFYVNDAYAMSGVDTTEIKEGENYAFKAEKA